MGPCDVRDLLALLAIPRVGPIRIRALLERFQEPGRIFAATPRELLQVRGIDRTLAVHIVRATDRSDFVDDQLRRLKSSGAEVIPFWDERYPSLLGRIYDPPTVLFVLGTVSEADHAAIAVVGTRRPSHYGERITSELARQLTERKLTIVSGLARGIDTLAHEAALTAGGRTLAVLGSGVDVPYPPENIGLIRRIVRNGAVVSEFPMGTKPDATNFPRRNRIVSGLSLGTVVVESGLEGGAMITASCALDQDREVFAVPGSILDERSTGPHALIREGRAKLISGIDDILAELQLSRSPVAATPVPSLPALTLFEQTILDAVAVDPRHIDDIVASSGLGPADVLVALLGLEFKGLVRQLPGKWFVKI